MDRGRRSWQARSWGEEHLPTLGVVVVRGVLVVWVAGLFACDEQPAATSRPSQAVARLSSTVGEVSHRAAQTIAWRTAAAGKALHQRDAIQTGGRAGAEVSFVHGAQLRIGERALVVIEAPEPEAPQPRPRGAERGQARAAGPTAVARVERGVVRGTVKPGAAPVRVVTADGQEARIVAHGGRPTTFRATVKDGGKLELAVIDGEAQVAVAGESARLGRGQLVDVEQGRALGKPVDLLPYPQLVAPAVDARLHAGARLKLQWKAVAGAALYRVQVGPANTAAVVGFQQREVDARVTVAEYELPELRPQQSYIWRVSSIDAAGHEGEFGFARRFHVLSARASSSGLLSPPDNAGVLYVKDVRPITFRWKGEASSYELVIARSQDLRRQVLVRRRVSDHKLTLERLQRGVHYWGVYALGDDGSRRPLFRKPHRLVLTKRLPPGVQVPRSIGWK